MELQAYWLDGSIDGEAYSFSFYASACLLSSVYLAIILNPDSVAGYLQFRICLLRGKSRRDRGKYSSWPSAAAVHACRARVCRILQGRRDPARAWYPLQAKDEWGLILFGRKPENLPFGEYPTPAINKNFRANHESIELIRKGESLFFSSLINIMYKKASWPQ